MSVKPQPAPVVTTYEELAAEYYTARHPTCANFREASASVVTGWLAGPLPEGIVCDVGAGKSIVAETLAARGEPLDRVILVDSSASMLRHSQSWIDAGARAIVADAEALPLDGGGVALLVASLGDPYDGQEFWSEARRVVRPGGQVFFTTPSYDWAVAFRRSNQDSPFDRAVFALADGRHIAVPSFILPREQQCEVIAKAGFRTDEVVDVPLSAIAPAARSAKLMSERGEGASIVTAYRALRTNGPHG
ncbi:MAG TPA: class I SAM-dependent methyltransferase [Candidatus Limnocylindrales bacterium]|nr:class I SAM-dependent methyltransferase [Candidatus Limnocylindrales bacterium]